MDHSIPGACAWGIEIGSGWPIYSGDLRLHGEHAGLIGRFIEQVGRLRTRALVFEGTNVQRETNVAEQEVYQNGLKAITGSEGLVIADFSPRDVDRLLSFLQIARDTDRKLANTAQGCLSLKDHASSGAGDT